MMITILSTSPLWSLAIPGPTPWDYQQMNKQAEKYEEQTFKVMHVFGKVMGHTWFNVDD